MFLFMPFKLWFMDFLEALGRDWRNAQASQQSAGEASVIDAASKKPCIDVYWAAPAVPFAAPLRLDYAREFPPSLEMLRFLCKTTR